MPLTISATWPAATSSSASDPAYEVIGPQVFRFEYCYLLTSGSLSITPPANISGIAAFVVDIATIDAQAKCFLRTRKLRSLAGQLSDYASNMAPGQLRNNWQNTINANTTLPRPALSGVRCTNAFSISRRLS